METAINKYGDICFLLKQHLAIPNIIKNGITYVIAREMKNHW